MENHSVPAQSAGTGKVPDPVKRLLRGIPFCGHFLAIRQGDLHISNESFDVPAVKRLSCAAGSGEFQFR
jgi:hypothetical protein